MKQFSTEEIWRIVFPIVVVDLKIVHPSHRCLVSDVRQSSTISFNNNPSASSR